MTEFETLTHEAKRVGVSEKTLRRRIASGELPAYRIGTRIRLKPADVDALLRPIPTVGNVA